MNQLYVDMLLGAVALTLMLLAALGPKSRRQGRTALVPIPVRVARRDDPRFVRDSLASCRQLPSDSRHY